MSEYICIDTSAEVYAVIMAAHRESLEGFSSYSAPEGSPIHHPSTGVMKTEFAFKNTKVPIIGINTCWEIVDGKEKPGTRKHKYWLCIGNNSE